METKPAEITAPRVEVPQQLWELIVEVARIMDVTPRWVFKSMLMRLEHAVLHGQAAVLGFEWERALKQLNGKGRLFDDVRPEEQPLLAVLHRSARAKSGFIGVYSNGKGFRAEGKNPETRDGVITLGTFPTAEGAALARYHHYKRHGMIYGELEKLVDEMRKNYALTKEWSDDRIKHEIIWDRAQAGLPIDGLTPEERALESVKP